MLKAKAKRSAKRMKRHHSAWITVDGILKHRECRLLDVSSQGAKLFVEPNTVGIERFDLVLVPNGPELPCEVVWRRGRILGIKFS